MRSPLYFNLITGPIKLDAPHDIQFPQPKQQQEENNHNLQLTTLHIQPHPIDRALHNKSPLLSSFTYDSQPTSSLSTASSTSSVPFHLEPIHGYSFRTLCFPALALFGLVFPVGEGVSNASAASFSAAFCRSSLSTSASALAALTI